MSWVMDGVWSGVFDNGRDKVITVVACSYVLENEVRVKIVSESATMLSIAGIVTPLGKLVVTECELNDECCLNENWRACATHCVNVLLAKHGVKCTERAFSQVCCIGLV